MALQWTKDLSVGVEQIDNQHKTLIDHANRLFEAGQAGKTREIIGGLLDFLEQYTKTHFRDEEQYMTSIHYPHLPEHRQYHADFIRSFDKIKQEYAKTGGNLMVILNANKLVVDWLTRHITVQDKKIGEYARGLKK